MYVVGKIDLLGLAITYVFILPLQMLCNTVKKRCLILTKKTPKI